MDFDDLLFERLEKIAYNLCKAMVSEINTSDKSILFGDNEKKIRLILTESFLFCINKLNELMFDNNLCKKNERFVFAEIENRLYQKYVDTGVTNDFFMILKKQ